MNWGDFFYKTNSICKAMRKNLKNTMNKKKEQFRRKLHSCSDEQLRAMEKKFSQEGGSSIFRPLLYEEMRRRNMV